MSDTPPSDETLQQPTEQSPPKRQSKPIPETLSAFLLESKSSAVRFVRALSARPPLADDDLSRSHEIINTQPEKIGRVVELARAAVRAAPQPGLLLRWCEQVLRSRDDALREWALDPGQDASSAFGDLLKWAHAYRKQGDREKGRLTESSVLLGFNLLVARRSLAPLEALRLIGAKGAEPRETYRVAKGERDARKLFSRASYKQLLDFALIAGLSDEEILSVKDELRRANNLVEGLRREKEALEADVETLRKEIDGLNQSLSKRDSKIVELEADIKNVKTRALQDLATLKARFRRQIGEHLAGLLADAWDAIDTNPPHPDVTRERLEIARETIQKELEWLDKYLD